MTALLIYHGLVELAVSKGTKVPKFYIMDCGQGL